MCDLVGDIDPCPDVFVSLTLNPDFGSKWDATVWIVVAVAGLCYVAHGLTGCRLPRGLMMLFGLLKLQTAATLAVLWAAGQPGPLTLGIAVSEVVWGALFFKWCEVRVSFEVLGISLHYSKAPTNSPARSSQGQGFYLNFDRDDKRKTD